jgi:hypothetical protein
VASIFKYNTAYHRVHSSSRCPFQHFHVQTWLTVRADTYLPLLRVIPGDTRQFKATFQLQSRPHPNCYSKGNAVETPPPIHLIVPRLKVAVEILPLIHLGVSRLKVVEADDEESKQTAQRLQDH